MRRIAVRGLVILADSPRRGRLLLTLVAFFTCFALVRAITHAIRNHVGPFQNLAVGGTHIHHLVLGIALLIGIGYLWMLDIGVGNPASDWPARITVVGYGVGVALTLDEFALWLNLRDVYWEQQGRYSVDALLIFGSLLVIGMVAAPALHAIAYEARLHLRRFRGPDVPPDRDPGTPDAS